MSQDELIQVVNDKQYEDFGYLIIRTAYGDDAAYEKWSEEFGSLIEKSVVQRGEAMEEMLNKLMTAMVAEPVLHRASWKKIQELVGLFSWCPCFAIFNSLFLYLASS